MELADLASAGFVALSLATLAFFAHQIAWLVRYRTMLRQLIAQDAEQRRERLREVLDAWDELERDSWREGIEQLGGDDEEGLTGFVALVERHLRALLEADATRPRLALRLSRAVLAGESLDGPVLTALLPDGEQVSARLELQARVLQEPTPPPEAVYQLDVRSRYGWWRRTLVFVTGLADVVYSSSHVTRMAQHAHLSTATILRRLSLVVLLVVGIILEVVLGLREALARWLAPWLQEAGWAAELPAWLVADLPANVALVAWTTLVAGLYFSLFFAVRRRSKRHLRELGRLRDEQPQRLARIRQRHLDALEQWARQQGSGLDEAVASACRHLRLLARRDAQRLRLRLVGTDLQQVSRRLTGALLAHLPEAGGELRDAATGRKRSLLHLIWPRRGEMVDVVEQAACRRAWQRLELGSSELRRGQPDPTAAAAFWRQLVSEATLLGDLLPPGEVERLRRDYQRYAEGIVSDASGDLDSLGVAAREVLRQLERHMQVADSSLGARFDLADQRIAADGAELLAAIVRAREAARLEAMAFEI